MFNDTNWTVASTHNISLRVTADRDMTWMSETMLKIVEARVA